MAVGQSDLFAAGVGGKTMAMSFNESNSYETAASWQQQQIEARRRAVFPCLVSSAR